MTDKPILYWFTNGETLLIGEIVPQREIVTPNNMTAVRAHFRAKSSDMPVWYPETPPKKIYVIEFDRCANRRMVVKGDETQTQSVTVSNLKRGDVIAHADHFYVFNELLRNYDDNIGFLTEMGHFKYKGHSIGAQIRNKALHPDNLMIPWHWLVEKHKKTTGLPDGYIFA